MEKVILLGSAIIFIAFVVMPFVEYRNGQLAVAAERYEACVQAEYGTSPVAWYTSHGEYPDCHGH